MLSFIFTIFVEFNIPFLPFSEEWEKVNITDNDNGTLSFHYKRTYTFVPELSAGPDDDSVVVPNIPMLVSVDSNLFVASVLYLAFLYQKIVKILKSQYYLT